MRLGSANKQAQSVYDKHTQRVAVLGAYADDEADVGCVFWDGVKVKSGACGERQSDRVVSQLGQVVLVIGHSRYHGAPDEDRGGHGRVPVGPGRFPVGPGRSRNRA